MFAPIWIPRRPICRSSGYPLLQVSVVCEINQDTIWDMMVQNEDTGGGSPAMLKSKFDPACVASNNLLNIKGVE